MHLGSSVPNRMRRSTLRATLSSAVRALWLPRPQGRLQLALDEVWLRTPPRLEPPHLRLGNLCVFHLGQEPALGRAETHGIPRRRRGVEDLAAVRCVCQRAVKTEAGPRRARGAVMEIDTSTTHRLPSLEEIRAAAHRVSQWALRTPLVRPNVDEAPAEVYLKLENLNRSAPSRSGAPATPWPRSTPPDWPGASTRRALGTWPRGWPGMRDGLASPARPWCLRPRRRRSCPPSPDWGPITSRFLSMSGGR